MSGKRITVEVWICYDEEGNAQINTDRDYAIEEWEENFGGAYWLRCLTVEIPLPRVQTVVLPNYPDAERIEVVE